MIPTHWFACLALLAGPSAASAQDPAPQPQPMPAPAPTPASVPSPERAADLKKSAERRAARRYEAKGAAARRKEAARRQLAEMQRLDAEHEASMAQIRSAVMAEEARQAAINDANRRRAQRLRDLSSTAAGLGTPVTVSGRIAAGIVAVGAETTGTTLTTADGSVYELDLSAAGVQPASGTDATVSGLLVDRAGVEVPRRRLITVTAFKAVGAETPGREVIPPVAKPTDAPPQAAPKPPGLPAHPQPPRVVLHPSPR